MIFERFYSLCEDAGSKFTVYCWSVQEPTSEIFGFMPIIILFPQIVFLYKCTFRPTYRFHTSL